jgi:hypothetical protein
LGRHSAVRGQTVAGTAGLPDLTEGLAGESEVSPARAPCPPSHRHPLPYIVNPNRFMFRRFARVASPEPLPAPGAHAAAKQLRVGKRAAAGYKERATVVMQPTLTE